MKTKFFIVDDHFMVVEGIKAMLQDEVEIGWMGHAYNVDTCLSFLQHRLPDVLLMDITFPIKAALICARRCLKHILLSPIIGVSA